MRGWGCDRVWGRGWCRGDMGARSWGVSGIGDFRVQAVVLLGKSGETEDGTWPTREEA